jgi:hypothetical protein
VLVLEDDLPVLTDFGVVKDLDDDGETAMGVVVGTLNYASPEQLRGEAVDARTDLYGLGCTLYYMLTGKVPFERAGQAELVLAHLTRAPEPPSHHDPGIPADLEQVVLRLMAKDPAERFPSAADVAAALSATPSPAGVPLAGRKRAMRRIAEALERVAAGEGCVVRVSGRPGTGKRWATSALREGALRRGLAVVEPHEAAALDAAIARVGREALLVVTQLPVANPHATVHLEPLRRADLRRSVVAASPGVSDPAALAERLYRATGGLPALLLPLLRSLASEPAAFEGGLPSIPVEPWLEGLDLDSLEILQAVAVAPAPINAAELEAATQVPAEDPIRSLLDQGLIVAVGTSATSATGAGRYGRRYVVSALAFAQGALELAPDPEALRERVFQACGARAADGPLALPGLRHIHELLEAGQLGQAGLELDALEGGPPASPRGEVGALLARARLSWLSGDLADAGLRFGRASQQAPPGGRGRITAWLGLAVTELQMGQPQRAAELLEMAHNEARENEQLDLETMASIQRAWASAVAGRPGPALRQAVNQVGVARALGQPVLECIAMEVQGRLLLELGLPAEASRVLADISALAHAAGLPRERWQAHVLRARATLDLDPVSPTNAAAATERLLRVLGGQAAPDPLGFTGLAHALRARAAARLSDARTCRAAAARAELCLGDSPSPLAWIARMQLARAAWASGDAAVARASLTRIERNAAELGYAFIAWQARKLDATMRGAELDSPTSLLEGMEPSWVEAMTREPEPS